MQILRTFFLKIKFQAKINKNNFFRLLFIPKDIFMRFWAKFKRIKFWVFEKFCWPIPSFNRRMRQDGIQIVYLIFGIFRQKMLQNPSTGTVPTSVRQEPKIGCPSTKVTSFWVGKIFNHTHTPAWFRQYYTFANSVQFYGQILWVQQLHFQSQTAPWKYTPSHSQIQVR